MRKVPLVSCVQVNGVATSSRRFALEMLQEGGSEPGFVTSCDCDQIVNVENVSPRQSIQETISGQGWNGISFRDVSDFEAFAGLGTPALDQLVFVSKVRPEFLVRGPAAANFDFVACGANLYGCFLHT